MMLVRATQDSSGLLDIYAYFADVFSAQTLIFCLNIESMTVRLF